MPTIIFIDLLSWRIVSDSKCNQVSINRTQLQVNLNNLINRYKYNNLAFLSNKQQSKKQKGTI